jgi:hypothetical protein
MPDNKSCTWLHSNLKKKNYLRECKKIKKLENLRIASKLAVIYILWGQNIFFIKLQKRITTYKRIPEHLFGFKHFLIF